MDFVTIREAAKMLGKKVRTIRYWIHEGKINAIKTGSGYKWLICMDEIERVLGNDVEVKNAD